MPFRVLLSVIAGVSLFFVGVTNAKPPNVVMIISDDQAWTDYGFMGHPVIQTPHLDRLANESVLFRHGYLAAPLCRPSLAALITGLHPHQHKIAGNDPARRQASPQEYRTLRERLIAHIDHVPTLPRLLAASGYLSHQSGKWWEGNFARGGFTHGMTRGFPNQGGRHGDAGLTIGRQGLQPIFRFIDAAQKSKKPFFIWYAPFLPHSPHTPPKRLLDKYRDKTESIHIARYWAMCEWFDETCGELLGHLDDRNLKDDTLVVYVADNGWIQQPDSPRFGPRSKRSPYEGGVRTPIMLRWPGRLTPGENETLVSSVDLAPTILSACELKPTPAMTGLNLIDVLAGKTPPRDTVFGAAYEHDVQDLDDPAKSLQFRFVVESARWKLITPALKSEGELYDLRSDPHERNNLAARNLDIVRRLAGKLDAWWKPGS